MSKWTEIRDGVLEALDVDNVTEELKDKMTANLIDSGIPAIETVADKFIGQIQEQAKAESGWTKIRDSIVLPLVINGGIWFVKYVLSKTQKDANA